MHVMSLKIQAVSAQKKITFLRIMHAVSDPELATVQLLLSVVRIG